MFVVFASALCGSACVALWRAFLAWEQEVKARANAELKLAKAIESGTVKTENACPDCARPSIRRETIVCPECKGLGRVKYVSCWPCSMCDGNKTIEIVVDNRKKAS